MSDKTKFLVSFGRITATRVTKETPHTVTLQSGALQRKCSVQPRRNQTQESGINRHTYWYCDTLDEALRKQHAYWDALQAKLDRERRELAQQQQTLLLMREQACLLDAWRYTPAY
jgi:hypothetical protein